MKREDEVVVVVNAWNQWRLRRRRLEGEERGRLTGQVDERCG